MQQRRSKPKQLASLPPDPKVAAWEQELRKRKQRFVDASRLTLRGWLRLLGNPPDDAAFVTRQFPTHLHREQFIDQIHRFSDMTVRILLHNFLPGRGTYGFDLFALQAQLMTPKESRVLDWYGHRLMMHYVSNGEDDVWEGIHWALELLPERPAVALEVISAFYGLAIPYLSDAFIGGIDDAMAIIRYRYIVARREQPKAEAAVASLSPRDFEYLVALALQQEGFETLVTQASKDGGVDIWARRPDLIRLTAVQCKHAEVVGVGACREILHEAELATANSAIVATSGRFTRGAREKLARDRRLRLLDGGEVIGLLNASFGPGWHTTIDSVVAKRKAMAVAAPDWLPRKGSGKGF